MYDEYPTIYESNLNENFIYWIIFGIIVIIICLLTLFALSKIFKKANRSGIRAYIPIYNIFPLLEITNLPKSYFILLFIPIIGIPFWFKLYFTLAKLFKKKKGFALGLFFLPFIFFPILAFNDSEYIGINLVAMEGKTTVEDIPVVDEGKNNPIEIEVNDQVDIKSNSVNMSIGGGVYQKEYTNSMLNVDSEKVLKNDDNKSKEEVNGLLNSGDKRIIDVDFANSNNNQENNNVVDDKPNNDLFSVSYIDSIQVQKEQPQSQPTIEQPISNNTQDNNILNNLNKVEYTQPVSNTIEPVKVESKVTTNVEEPKVCPNCGTRVQDGAKMCFICGQSLE